MTKKELTRQLDGVRYELARIWKRLGEDDDALHAVIAYLGAEIRRQPTYRVVKEDEK